MPLALDAATVKAAEFSGIRPPSDGRPAARAAALRDAFTATMKDPGFIADAKKRKAPIDPRPAEYVDATVKDGYSISRKTVDRLKAIVGLSKSKK